MIYKSYIIEQDIGKIQKNITLFYGENLGLINDFKLMIKNFNKTTQIMRFNEEDLLKNNSILLREINNKSLFEENIIIFINQSTDKILNLILDVEEIENDVKIFLFSNNLEKKSKLRNHFEKSKNFCIIPCYEDNEITLKSIILNSLKDFRELSPQNVNLILDNCNLNRAKLRNELDKIKDFFLNKTLDTTKLEKLLNIKTNENFDKLKDAALVGDKKTTNKLLSDTMLEKEKNILYLNVINQRLCKLLEIKNYGGNIERAVDSIRPPIFWKDKANFITQARIWDKKKLKLLMKNTYDIELRMKNNSSINMQILIKKLLVDLCEVANAS